MESGYWEELIGSLLGLSFLLTMFMWTNCEVLILDDKNGTVEIVRKTIAGYNVLHIVRIATCMIGTAYVKTHVHKGKRGRKTYTYSLECNFDGKSYSLSKQSNKREVEHITNELNRFVTACGKTERAQQNFVK